MLLFCWAFTACKRTSAAAQFITSKSESEPWFHAWILFLLHKATIQNLYVCVCYMCLITKLNDFSCHPKLPPIPFFFVSSEFWNRKWSSCIQNSLNALDFWCRNDKQISQRGCSVTTPLGKSGTSIVARNTKKYSQKTSRKWSWQMLIINLLKSTVFFRRHENDVSFFQSLDNDNFTFIFENLRSFGIYHEISIPSYACC